MANRRTPEHSDDETGDENELPLPPPKPAVRHTIGGKKKAAPPAESKPASKPVTRVLAGFQRRVST